MDKWTLKSDLLGFVRADIHELLALTNKPYLNKGDVRRLTAASAVIKKARNELLEYKAFIDTRLKNRDQQPVKPPVKEIDMRKKTLLLADTIDEALENATK